MTAKPMSRAGLSVHCPGLVTYSLDTAKFPKRFRGVVGYHICLTRGRSPVRTRTKTNSFFTQKFDGKINHNLPNCRFLVDVCNGIRSGSSDAGDNDDAVALRRVVLKD